MHKNYIYNYITVNMLPYRIDNWYLSTSSKKPVIYTWTGSVQSLSRKMFFFDPLGSTTYVCFDPLGSTTYVCFVKIYADRKCSD